MEIHGPPHAERRRCYRRRACLTKSRWEHGVEQSRSGGRRSRIRVRLLSLEWMGINGGGKDRRRRSDHLLEQWNAPVRRAARRTTRHWIRFSPIGEVGISNEPPSPCRPAAGTSSLSRVAATEEDVGHCSHSRPAPGRGPTAKAYQGQGPRIPSCPAPG